MSTNSSMLKQCQTELASLKKDLPRLKAVAYEAEKTFANSRAVITVAVRKTSERVLQ